MVTGESLVSTIVPIYNVEKYLEKCIDSICSQTYKHLEIILIDDGSSDFSSIICDEWAKKDERIKVIHQTNHGGGYARNVGLNIAKGDYILFVDSDDYISPFMVEILMSIFEKYNNIDIVECDYAIFFDEEIDFVNKKNEECVSLYSASEAMYEHIIDHYFRQLIWNKIYRREVVSDIRFPIGKKIDDEFWTYRVLGNAKRLARINSKLYAYRQQSNSIMHTIDISNRMQAIEAKCERHELVRQKFSELEMESCYSIYNACLYQGELIINSSEKRRKKDDILYLKSIIRKYPMAYSKYRNFSIKKKIWINMVQISFTISCKLRNILNSKNHI